MEVKICKLKEIKLIDGTIISSENFMCQPVLPTYGRTGDSCMDIYPVYYEYDREKDRHIYHSGLVFAIGNEEKYSNVGYKITTNIPNEMEIRPRSNLTKQDFYIPNSPGTLDWGYRGELLVIFKNRTSVDILVALNAIQRIVSHLLKSNPTTDKTGIKSLNFAINHLSNSIKNPPYKCDGEQRCAQLLIRGSERINWEEVDTVEQLGITERGDGGFGSTNK